MELVDYTPSQDSLKALLQRHRIGRAEPAVVSIPLSEAFEAPIPRTTRNDKLAILTCTLDRLPRSL
jgi:hypothetical protein